MVNDWKQERRAKKHYLFHHFVTRKNVQHLAGFEPTTFRSEIVFASKMYPIVAVDCR